MEGHYQQICNIFKVESFTVHQKKAIHSIINERKDVFVNLPTGAGKSLIYQALPKLFDEKFGGKHVVIVVSPLINLMRDQVKKLRDLGVSAVSLSEIESDEEEKALQEGKFSVVYGTPEALLKTERWRRMLSNKGYSKMVCAVAIDEAHVIKQWGTSSSSKYAAFREAYGRLHELRALLSPDVSFIALTATATLDTKKFILDTLCMNNPVEVQESPNKKNVMYSVTYIQQSHRIDDTFQWIVDEIINMGSSAERVIIYCQTIKQCSVVYSKLRACLGEHFHSGQSVESAVLEMLHSCTPQANKDNIIKSFQDPNGTVKALVATIAFGMGIDCKRVHTSVHFGPPKNVESYIQESGRIGRDGQLSKSYIIYQGILLGHVENNIKEYLKTTECRRKSLLSHFGISLGNVQSPQPAHLCCDNCALNCMCGMTQCKSYSIYPGILANPSQLNVELPISNVIREVTSTHYQKLKEELVKFQKKLLMDVIGKVSMGQMHLHIPPQMVIGFGQVQMNQVLEHCGSIFSVDDVYKFVEIWHHNHAHSIYLMLCNVFDNNEDTCITGACNLLIPTFDDDDDNVDEEDINDEWACFLDDSDLLNMALENLSISHLNDNDSNENIEESF